MDDMTPMTWFYFDGSTGAEIPSTQAKPIELDDLLEHFADMGDVKGNFIGISVETSAGEETCQAWFYGDGKFQIDVPRPSRGGSLQRDTDFAGVEAAFRAVANGRAPAQLTDLEFNAW